MAFKFSSLDIRYKDQWVENTFLEQVKGARHLAIVFPGAGYTTMGPMLYYTINALTQQGVDVLSVEYKNALGSLAREERLAALSEISLKALNAALKKKKYRRLTFVGKSMGTRALASLSRLTWDYHPEKIESIWLTPILSERNVVQEIGKLGSRQFLAIGTKDEHYYLPEILSTLPRSVEQFVIQGADHGLDIEGEAIASVQAMKDLVEKVLNFLST